MIGVGDIVVCVDDVPNPGWLTIMPLTTGGYYRVIGIEVAKLPFADAGQTGFILEGVPLSLTGGGCNSRRFRKVVPADPAFIEQIRKLKPHRKGVDA